MRHSDNVLFMIHRWLRVFCAFVAVCKVRCRGIRGEVRRCVRSGSVKCGGVRSEVWSVRVKVNWGLVVRAGQRNVSCGTKKGVPLAELACLDAMSLSIRACFVSTNRWMNLCEIEWISLLVASLLDASMLWLDPTIDGYALRDW